MAFALACLLPTAAVADWEIYVGGGLGISNQRAHTNANVGTGPVVEFRHSDSDTSPFLGALVGLEVPLDELVPREWLREMRLPSWPLRVEAEVVGLAEYDFRTEAGSNFYYSRVEVLTAFVNGSVAVPLTTMYQPFQYLFGLGRQPRARQWLEPGSFYGEVGIGMSDVNLRGENGVFNGSDEFIDFAWNAGLGLNYALTDKVDLALGYRFVCIAAPQCMAHSDGVDVEIFNGPAATGNDLKYELMSHQLRATVRVEVFEFLSPWR